MIGACKSVEQYSLATGKVCYLRKELSGRMPASRELRPIGSECAVPADHRPSLPSELNLTRRRSPIVFTAMRTVAKPPIRPARPTREQRRPEQSDSSSCVLFYSISESGTISTLSAKRSWLFRLHAGPNRFGLYHRDRCAPVGQSGSVERRYRDAWRQHCARWQCPRRH